jgi:hypothetical protein
LLYRIDNELTGTFVWIDLLTKDEEDDDLKDLISELGRIIDDLGLEKKSLGETQIIENLVIDQQDRMVKLDFRKVATVDVKLMTENRENDIDESLQNEVIQNFQNLGEVNLEVCENLDNIDSCKI